MTGIVRRILIAILSGGCLSAPALAEKPQPGQPAPQMAIETLLNAPAGAQATLEALRGKAIVLEFWATWCAPCVAAIPHMNELTDHFKDQPIVFISITNEKQDKITKFLKEKRAIHGWVGLDFDGSLMKSYGITGIPVTVLIDAQGKIADITYPTNVTQKTIEALLAGTLKGSPKPAAPVVAVEAESDGKSHAEPLFQLRIVPTARTDQGWASSHGPGRIGLTGCDVSSLMQFAYEFPAYRTDSRVPPGGQRYDVSAIAPAGQEKRLRELLREAACTTFGVRARQERRMIDCYVLAASAGGAKLTPTVMEEGSSVGGAGDGSIVMVNQPMATLCDQLAVLLKTTVIDETGQSDRYDMTLRPPGTVNAESLSAAVREQFGLELKPVKREVEFLVIESVGE